MLHHGGFWSMHQPAQFKHEHEVLVPQLALSFSSAARLLSLTPSVSATAAGTSADLRTEVSGTKHTVCWESTA